MRQQIVQLALLVPDYDEAIRYYTGTLGFELLEDTALGGGKRWVRVAPRGSHCALLLARAANADQSACIGNQTGGRVFLFLHTDDIDRDVQRWSAAGVPFEGPVRSEAYGRVVVFSDLYGNKWDLIEPSAAAGSMQ